MTEILTITPRDPLSCSHTSELAHGLWERTAVRCDHGLGARERQAEGSVGRAGHILKGGETHPHLLFPSPSPRRGVEHGRAVSGNSSLENDRQNQPEGACAPGRSLEIDPLWLSHLAVGYYIRQE